APGNGATGRSSRELGLRHLGPVTALELQRHNAQTDQMTLDFNQLSAEAENNDERNESGDVAVAISAR
ncbi:hypothetical protein, partial [Bifidobacterium moukalabense]|uniref:hypothetical protein n=1 Tax=Bifidobacterium moukalabense TaxID=1333651 RepID=UPI001BB1E818